MQKISEKNWIVRRSMAIAALMTMAGQAACKATVPSASVKDAIVSSTVASDAFQIVEDTKGYLPYEYSANGCHSRATFMQMELAVANIPSRVVYVRARYDAENMDWDVDSPRLGSEQWVYHVAPVIKVVDQPDATAGTLEIVLDPGLAPSKKGGALILEDWLDAMRAKNFSEAPRGAVSREFNPAPNPFAVSRAPTTDDGPLRHRNVRGQQITTVGEMPGFTVGQIIVSFTEMDLYLIKAADDGRILTRELIKRRKKLLSRTLELVGVLRRGDRIRAGTGEKDEAGSKEYGETGSMEELEEKNLRRIQSANEDRSAKSASLEGKVKTPAL